MSSGGSALGPGAEFDAIRAMVARWGALAGGIGDDAALLHIPRAGQIVVSTDTSTENVHFRRDWLSPHEIGYRAAAAAMSDLAAMAGTPLGVLVALTVPELWRAELDAIADGIGEAVRLSGAQIIGGDTTRGDVLSLTITVLGSASAVLRRSGAREGDRVYVTGELGGPFCALRGMQRGKPIGAAFRERFARPVPRLSEARWLAARGATSAIDVSDGVIADAAHIAAASGVRIELYLDQLPLFPGVAPFDAARSGEEYELLLTAPRELAAHAFRDAFALPLTEIGMVVGHGEAAVITLIDGRPVELPAGFDHFAQP